MILFAIGLLMAFIYFFTDSETFFKILFFFIKMAFIGYFIGIGIKLA